LITTFTFPPQRDGVSHVVHAHATGLARLGYEVTIATSRVPARQPSDAPPGVRVVEFDTWGNGRRFRGGGYRGDIRGYQQFIAGCQADAIICHCWQIWSTDLAAAAFCHHSAKKILVSHGVNCAHVAPTLRSIYNWLAWRPYVRQMPRMLRAFDHLVVLSGNVELDWFYDHQLSAKLNLDRVSTIPNGAYVERFSKKPDKAREFRTQFQLGNRKVVLCVGHFSASKNQQGAVTAFIQAAVPDSVLVLIGGTLNDYARRVQAMQLRMAPQARILYLEKQPQETVAAAYCAADVFVCPSRLEIQPLVLVDAMAAGVPWVSTDVGCVREMRGGLVAPLEQFGPQIRRILSEKSLRSKLAADGTDASRQVYCWEAVVRQYDRLLRQLWGEPLPQEKQHEAG
jgi:glycosyltransferase involved in cell wall biosynthesis